MVGQIIGVSSFFAEKRTDTNNPPIIRRRHSIGQLQFTGEHNTDGLMASSLTYSRGGGAMNCHCEDFSSDSRLAYAVPYSGVDTTLSLSQRAYPHANAAKPKNPMQIQAMTELFPASSIPAPLAMNTREPRSPSASALALWR